MVTNSDFEKWQKAIQGIEKGQKNLSSEELSAFHALKELFGNGNFDSGESGGNIKIIEDNLKQHDKHRLLQIHLKNFIDLCEQNFKLPTFQPPIIQPPIIQPPTFRPPVIQPPTFQPPVNQEIKSSEPVIEKPIINSAAPKIEPPAIATKGKGSNKQLIFIIIAIAIFVGGWLIYKEWDAVGKWEPISKWLDNKKETPNIPVDTMLVSEQKVDSTAIVSEQKVDSTAIVSERKDNLATAVAEQKGKSNPVAAAKPAKDSPMITSTAQESKNTASNNLPKTVSKSVIPDKSNMQPDNQITVPTPAQLNDLLYKITNSDDNATDEIRNVLGNSLRVEGATNISNVQQLITDVSNGGRYKVTKVNANADGKVVSITVSK